SFMFLHPAAMLDNDIWITRVVVDMAALFLLLVLAYIIGLVFYKGGILAGGSILGLAAAVLLFGVAQGWLIEMVINTAKNLDLWFFAQMFGIAIVLYGLSFFLIRTVTIVKAR